MPRRSSGVAVHDRVGCGGRRSCHRDGDVNRLREGHHARSAAPGHPSRQCRGVWPNEAFTMNIAGSRDRGVDKDSARHGGLGCRRRGLARQQRDRVERVRLVVLGPVDWVPGSTPSNMAANSCLCALYTISLPWDPFRRWDFVNYHDSYHGTLTIRGTALAPLATRSATAQRPARNCILSRSAMSSTS